LPPSLLSHWLYPKAAGRWLQQYEVSDTEDSIREKETTYKEVRFCVPEIFSKLPLTFYWTELDHVLISEIIE
jgi:hypothetical protein